MEMSAGIQPQPMVFKKNKFGVASMIAVFGSDDAHPDDNTYYFITPVDPKLNACWIRLADIRRMNPDEIEMANAGALTNSGLVPANGILKP